MSFKEKFFYQGSRWQPLEKYFKYYTVDDLEGLTDEEIMGWADKKDRPLMHLFIKRELVKWLYEPNPYAPARSTPSSKLLPNKSSDSVLDLKQRLYPTKFASLDSTKPTLSSVKIPSRVFTGLDVSENNLMDDDIPLLRKLLDSLPQCKYVNLSRNRIYGKGEPALVNDPLKEILATKDIVWVDITVNPLASIDRVDFFASLSEGQLKKLIWIPSTWLAGNAWHQVLGNQQQLIDLVQSTHEAYYSTF